MKIYSQIKDFLFFDIETVREEKNYTEMLAKRSALNWGKIAKRFQKEEDLTPEAAYMAKAGLFVEYAKVISVCFGSFDATLTPKIGALSDENEEVLLNRVADYLNKYYTKFPETILCGHNIKEFDIPFLIKRMIKYKIRIPTIFLNYLSAKSWEQKATDTQYDWRMAGNRFMGLDSIAEYLDIESSKSGEINGENLGDYYWNSPEPMNVKLEKVNTYCKADVRVLMDFAKHINSVL